MQIDPVVNPKVGSYIDISVKTFKGAKVIPEGKHRVLVEKYGTTSCSYGVIGINFKLHTKKKTDGLLNCIPL